MATGFEDLRVLRMAERVADGIWKEVVRWDKFARDVVGKQMSRAADSVGANIAESYGRYHYGEKLQFLYYARGSVFEAKYWLNRALVRNLMKNENTNTYADDLSELAHKINLFAGSIKQQKKGDYAPKFRETAVVYETTDELAFEVFLLDDSPLFTEEELTYLASSPMKNDD